MSRSWHFYSFTLNRALDASPLRFALLSLSVAFLQFLFLVILFPLFLAATWTPQAVLFILAFVPLIALYPLIGARLALTLTARRSI